MEGRANLLLVRRHTPHPPRDLAIWIFVFFHFMHVILGMVILAAVAVKAHRGGYSAAHHTGVETGASYWHMVDLVWLILFPLVYVMR